MSIWFNVLKYFIRLVWNVYSYKNIIINSILYILSIKRKHTKWFITFTYLLLNLACLGLMPACKGDLVGGDNGEVSPSSGIFSSSSLIDGNVSDGTPFISDSCC